MKPNHPTAILLLSCCVLFTSCNYLSSIDLTEKSDMEKVQQKITAFVTPEMRISEIGFLNEKNQLTNIMGSIDIVYTTASDTATRMRLLIRLPHWDVLENAKDKHKRKQLSRAGAVSIENIDLTVIPDIIRQATDSVNALDLEYAGTRHFTIRFAPDASPSYEFEASGKSKTHDCQMKSIGRRSARQYCYCRAVPFVVDSNGNMDMLGIGEFEWVW